MSKTLEHYWPRSRIRGEPALTGIELNYMAAKRPRRGGGKKRPGGGRRRNQLGASKSKKDVPESEQCFEAEGSIEAVLAGTMFRVKLDNTDHVVLAHISGKMRKRFIRLVIGDRVKLEMSPYDTEKARIVFRLR